MQEPSDMNKQAHMRVEKYPPVVNPDCSVTFRLKAPLAHCVQIEPLNGQPENNGYNGLGSGIYDLVKDDDGIWSVRTPPAVPGLHTYWLVVDGVRVNDTTSKTYGSSVMQACGVDIPEPGVDFYDIKDVPHGEVRHKWYYSKITNMWRRAFIYFPAEYDAFPEKRYPVFILRHGGGEDETGWVEQGRANFILDNLIAENKAVPMIVVMDWGQAPIPGMKVHIPSTPPPQEIIDVTIQGVIGYYTAIELTGYEPDGDPLSYQIITYPEHGNLFDDPPIMFTASDGVNVSEPATITINVRSNTDPIGYPQTVQAVSGYYTSITLTGYDADNDPLIFIVVTPPQHGTLSGTAPNLTYFPDPGYIGPDFLEFVVSDDIGQSPATPVDINVVRPNSAPVANPQSLIANTGVPLSLILTGSDPDGDSLSFQVTAQPDLHIRPRLSRSGQFPICGFRWNAQL